MISPTTMNQFNAGQVWDLTDPVDETSRGNHCLYLEGFTPTGFLAYTWGKRVQLTWRWWHKYCEEAFCVVDDKDAFLPNDPIDITLLKGYMDAIGAG